VPDDLRTIVAASAGRARGALLAAAIALIVVACAGAAPSAESEAPGSLATAAASPTPRPTGQTTAQECTFLGLFSWGRTVPRDRSPDGSYTIELKPCENLWFSSESATLDGNPLCEAKDKQNCVLMYAARSNATVQIGVADPADLGNEWWGLTRADFDQIITAWAKNALKAPNCTDGCESLMIQQYVDGELVATEAYPQ
jgi:hypothetical protein